MPTASVRSARALVAGVLAGMLLLTACSSEPVEIYSPPPQADGSLPDEIVAQLESAVQTGIAASGATGAIVGVWAPWSGSWVTTVGTTASGGPLSTDMAFRIGDVTRLMTCDILYGMTAEGQVTLEDRVTDYVSGVPDLSDVTLLSLCNGTTGIGSARESVVGRWMTRPDRVWAPLELASFGIAQPRTEVGAYAYSDASYLLLGIALERASGKSASELVAEYVSTPLGLENTSLPDSAAASPGSPYLDGTHRPTPEGFPVCEETIDISVVSSSLGFTDTGVVSTIGDLGRYIQAEARQVLPTPAGVDRFATPLPAYPEAPTWFQATGGALLVGPLIGQAGWTAGYATAAFSDPETGFTVAVVLNTQTVRGEKIASLALQLAAIASKVPATAGYTAPDFGLPFTAEQYAESVAANPVCPLG